MVLSTVNYKSKKASWKRCGNPISGTEQTDVIIASRLDVHLVSSWKIENNGITGIGVIHTQSWRTYRYGTSSNK